MPPQFVLEFSEHEDLLEVHQNAVMVPDIRDIKLGVVGGQTVKERRFINIGSNLLRREGYGSGFY